MANVGVSTVNQIEVVIEWPSRYPGVASIVAALKAAGMVFLYGAVRCGYVRSRKSDG
jgi:hypothetical protein